MVELEVHYAKWNKSEKTILYDHLYAESKN